MMVPSILRQSRSSSKKDKDFTGQGMLTQEAAFDRYRRLGQEPVMVDLPISVRINTLKILPEVLLTRFSKVGIELKPVDYLKFGYQLVKAKFSIGASLEYLLGYLYTQEAASQLPVQVLNPLPGELVADMAAAPGGKTTQLAQWMKNEGVVIALDKTDRVFAIKNNLERCGVSNVVVLKQDARFMSDLHLEFDKILLDAPCSGNFAGDRYWFGKRSFSSLHNRSVLQKELIKSAFQCLKVGGIMVYSTCSLEPEENEFVVDFVLRKCKGLNVIDCNTIGDPGLTDVFGRALNPQVAKCRRLWPWNSKTQGFFIAKFQKGDPSNNSLFNGGNIK